MIICGTGHRPEDCEAENIVRTKARVKLQRAESYGTFITGMAAGFDLWAGDEARKLGYKIVCAVPWRGHQPRKADADLYAYLLAAASRIVYIVDEVDFPGAWCYHKRNHWMVDNATHVLAYLDPAKTRGGTFECVKYARGKKPVYNCYEDAPF